MDIRLERSKKALFEKFGVRTTAGTERSATDHESARLFECGTHVKSGRHLHEPFMVAISPLVTDAA